MSTSTAPAPAPAHRSLHDRVGNAGARARRDVVMRLVLLATVGVALLPLFAILFVTVGQGAPAISLDFFTQNIPFRARDVGGGYAPGIVGTLYMVGIAIVLAIPLGIVAAVFLVEFPERKLAIPIRFFTDVMTGIPSVFVGLFVYTALVINAGLGFGTLPGAVALAILMLPIVVRSSEEVLRLVPSDLRNAAYGLGARRYQTVCKVVLPAAGPGLATSAMLAVARAAGETAPLLFTAVGAREVITQLIGRPQGAIPLSILEEARMALPATEARAWAGALTLMALVLLFTVCARLIGRRNQLGDRD